MSRGTTGPAGRAGRRPGGRTVGGSGNSGGGGSDDGGISGCLKSLLGLMVVPVALTAVLCLHGCRPAPAPQDSPRPLQTARQPAP